MAVYNLNGELIGDVVDADAELQALKLNLRDTASLIQLMNETGTSATMQGGCTDGEYIYYIYYNINTFKKYNILTKESTSVTYESGLYGHANDMTYNPNTGKIYVTYMDDPGKIFVVNPSDLSNESSFNLTDSNGNIIRAYGLAYDRKNNWYITADSGTNGLNFSFFNGNNFSFIKTVTITRSESYTLQGIEVDGTYIYKTLWDSTNHRNYVYVMDYDGNDVKVIELPDANEVETLMNDWNGNWYVSFNVSGSRGKLYYCGLNEKIGFGAVEQLYKILNAYSA